MNKRITVFIATLLLLTTGFHHSRLQTDQSKWIEFSPKDGAFSIMIPDQPAQRSLSHNTDKGHGDAPLFELTKDDIKYVITYLDYPFSVEAGERDKLLTMGAEAGITNVGGKVVSNKAITLDIYPGREVEGEMQGIVYQSRVFLVKQRLYLLIVWTPSKKTGTENAMKFLESFKLKAE